MHEHLPGDLQQLALLTVTDRIINKATSTPSARQTPCRQHQGSGRV
jgi:hypothetical protein